VPAKYSVLYVDDEPDLLEIARLFLEESQEFTVDTRESAEVALDTLKNHRYDAIVSDFEMPGMNGIAFLKAVRKTYGDLPFVIFTGRSREAVVIEALNNGADFYLQKGGDPGALYAELMHVIRRTIQMRQAEASLAEQEQRYHDLQNATDLIQSMAPDGHFLFVNKKWQDTLGYREQDLPGLTLFDILHEESQEHCRNLFPRVLAGEDVGIINVVFKTRDGKKVYAEGFASCKITDGKPQYTRGIFKDITDRKKTETALQESEKKFRTIFESSPYPIAINTLPDGRFVEVNAAFLESSGYTEADVLGKNPVELGLLSLMDFGKLASRMLITGKLENVPLALTGKGGRRVHVLFSTLQVLIGGKPAIVTMTAEVTQLKRVEEELLQKNEDLHAAYEELTATEEELRGNYDELIRQEQALRASEEKYRLLTEVTNDVIYMIDTTGTITHISPQISRYGYTPDEVISRNFTEFLDPEDALSAAADLEKTLSTKTPTTTLVRIHDKAGNLHWLEDNGAPVVNSSGSVVAVSGILRDITERKNTENALKESEAKFRALVEHSLEAILITDLTGTLLFANQAAGHMVDTPDYLSLIGKKNVLEFIAPESHTDVINDFGKVAQGTDAYLMTYKLITETKREIWVESIGRKIPFEGSSAILVSLRDVTERKKSEIILRESENKFATVFRSSPVALTLVSGLDGKFVDVNDAFVRSTGFSREEVIGKTSEEIGIFANDNERERMVSSLREQRNVYGMEMQCRIKSGALRTCQFSSGLVLMNGKPHILSTIEDITMRRNAEEAVRESGERYHFILKNANDGILVNELTPRGPGKFIDANDQACRILGMTPEEMEGVSLVDLDTPEMKERAPGVFQEIMRNHHAVFQTNYRTKDGQEKTLDISVSLFDLKGKPTMLSVVRDISSRKRMEDALLRTNRQLSLLSSITRHDVLNKITVIQGHLARSRKLGPGQDYPALLEKIEVTANVIKSQLEFTRVYQSLGEKEPEWQRPGEHLTSSHHPDSVMLHNELGNLEVYADLMLEKVFQNLVDNSLRHGGNVTEIRAHSRTDPDGLTLIFEDNGIGIPADEKEFIFDRGYGKNTGLGLFLAREILAITGMGIRETGEPGKGARFEITVPKGAYRLNPDSGERSPV